MSRKVSQFSLELAEVVVSIGLAQNFSALRALVTTGIQADHMSLHARSVALSAGARADEVDRVVQALVDRNSFTHVEAREILHDLRKK